MRRVSHEEQLQAHIRLKVQYRAVERVLTLRSSISSPKNIQTFLQFLSLRALLDRKGLDILGMIYLSTQVRRIIFVGFENLKSNHRQLLQFLENKAVLPQSSGAFQKK